MSGDENTGGGGAVGEANAPNVQGVRGGSCLLNLSEEEEFNDLEKYSANDDKQNEAESPEADWRLFR